MLALGIDNPLLFEFLDKPRPQIIANVFGELQNLKAVDDDLKLTKVLFFFCELSKKFITENMISMVKKCQNFH